MAEVIASKAPLGQKATKFAIEEGRHLDLDNAVKVEAKHFATCFESEDQREAMSAMLEKRKAAPFKGC
jgi:enoyl-CoA hydratase